MLSQGALSEPHATLLFHLGENLNWFQRLLHRKSFSVSHASSLPPAPVQTLVVRGLSFSYGTVPVLRSIDLEVGRGEICGLLGPNGCGKTTLFRCCMGFLHPEDGQVHICGTSIAHLRPSALAHLAAYVPQEHRQPFPFTAKELVLMGRTPHMNGWFTLGKNDDALAREAMERIGIAHLADQVYSRLSGGQRQLVLIARALAQQTPLILLDEPTSALDFSNQLAVWQALRDIASQGVAVLVCCHDPNHILWFCDKAAAMHEGRIIASGAPHTVITQEILQTLYGSRCMRIEAGPSSLVCPSSFFEQRR